MQRAPTYGSGGRAEPGDSAEQPASDREEELGEQAPLAPVPLDRQRWPVRYRDRVTDRSYLAENARELARLRSLVERLSDADLRRPVNPEWTVAATLLHVAFWDTRATWLAGKIARGEPFIAAEAEPEPPTWINDSARPFFHAVPPAEAARLAVGAAEEVDRRVAALPAERLWPNDRTSLLNAFRSGHRREHLDAIEAALRGGGG